MSKFILTVLLFITVSMVSSCATDVWLQKPDSGVVGLCKAPHVLSQIVVHGFYSRSRVEQCARKYGAAGYERLRAKGERYE
jgi:hypothetical protein